MTAAAVRDAIFCSCNVLLHALKGVWTHLGSHPPSAAGGLLLVPGQALTVPAPQLRHLLLLSDQCLQVAQDQKLRRELLSQQKGLWLLVLISKLA